jgi:translation elongation factor EF-Tu-like GTPase
MKIDAIFWIGAPPHAKLTNVQRAAARAAPGTVLAGEVVGTGTLKPGDVALHEGGRFKIERIEVFREHLERVQPPRNVGLVLGAQVNKDLFREGAELRFER